MTSKKKADPQWWGNTVVMLAASLTAIYLALDMNLRRLGLPILQEGLILAALIYGLYSMARDLINRSVPRVRRPNRD